jgi:hypothetical protein
MKEVEEKVTKRETLKEFEQVSISSTLNSRVFHTNVVLAAFITYMRTNIHRKNAAEMT